MSEFKGFSEPTENWSKLPHELIAALPAFTSLAELKCVLYVLRHTWGYGEIERVIKLTNDEFMNGRKRKDGTRIDAGVGMSEPSVISGLSRAVEDGFLTCDIDDRDLARVKKYYGLNLLLSGLKEFKSGAKEVSGPAQETLDRTEKDTDQEDTLEIDPVQSLLERHAGMTLGAAALDQWRLRYEMFGEQWFEEALKETVKQGGGRKMNIKYVTQVLENWRLEGGPPAFRGNGGKPVEPPKPVELPGGTLTPEQIAESLSILERKG